MKLWEQYYSPKTVDELVDLLNKHSGNARIIAGGTDLLVDAKAASRDPEPFPVLIDITSVTELKHIRAEDGLISIGAGVTHSQIVKSALIAEKATCLVESCGVVGGPQVRNVATLGGNVAHALPAGDGTTSLMVLDAEADIIHQGEARRVAFIELFLGPGQSLLDPTRDVLLKLHFKACGAGEGTAFKRIMRPQGVALPILGCAVWVKLDDSGTHYADVRVCIAPIAPKPTRVTEVEAALIGQPTNDETLEAALKVAAEVIHPRTSKYRATADYRNEMVAVLLRRTLPLAANRARTGEAIPEGVGA